MKFNVDITNFCFCVFDKLKLAASFQFSQYDIMYIGITQVMQVIGDTGNR